MYISMSFKCSLCVFPLRYIFATKSKRYYFCAFFCSDGSLYWVNIYFHFEILLPQKTMHKIPHDKFDGEKSTISLTGYFYEKTALPENFDLQNAVWNIKNALCKLPSSWFSNTNLLVSESLDILTFFAQSIVALKKTLKHL